MLPAFHREQHRQTQATMDEEIDARARRLARRATTIDLYAWTRVLALRVAMRALFGLDPDDRARTSSDARTTFEEALGFWSRDYLLQVLRGPRHAVAAADAGAPRELDALIFAEIVRRRATGERGEDILSLLLDATDEDGDGLSKRHIRDEVMTLLFAGHDTTTSTVAFLFYELARARRERARERACVDDRRARAARRCRAGDGARRDAAPVPAGVDRAAARASSRSSSPARTVPAGVLVNYCSWASHHLPDVWPEPERFRPSASRPRPRRELPKGAYVPFGGGSRTCIGMRFGQLEIRTIATAILERFEPRAARRLRAGDPPDADDRPEARAAGHRCARASRPRRARGLPPEPRVQCAPHGDLPNLGLYRRLTALALVIGPALFLLDNILHPKEFGRGNEAEQLREIGVQLPALAVRARDRAAQRVIMTGALLGLAFHVRRSQPTLGLIGGALCVAGAIGLGAGFAIDGFTWGRSAPSRPRAVSRPGHGASTRCTPSSTRTG